MTGKIRGLRSRDESRIATWIAPHPVPVGEWLRIDNAIGRILSDQERERLSWVIARYKFMKECPAIPAQDVRNTLQRLESSQDDGEVLRLFEQCDVRTRAYLAEALFCDIDFEQQAACSIDGTAEFWRISRPNNPVPLLCDRADLYRIAASVALRNVLKAASQGGRPVKGYQFLFADQCLELWPELTNSPLTISTKGKEPSPFVVFSEVLFGLLEGDSVSLSRVEELLTDARKRARKG